MTKYSRIPCSTCGGTKTMDCPRCDGSGRTNYLSDNIHENEKTCEKRFCTTCSGTGLVRCSGCAGNGYLLKSILPCFLFL